ncbi:branched-chain amino acid transport system substrate-binding protein [Methylobacterium sp. UNC300MFChir4.1]|uniref:ABC transporter substrate-binding protein n=1 Tax=Methylobacterium sp. UNC300MFChir4.1 TaxID=1502747 RepID=UPI0008C1B1E5|nr:ABC transporter substrate-binding protein [Methylobacterium sp. UNC300MFChir4.1]SEP37315.1 branched-chain amino acid transport system substrate-binding protein [Methylobacterium sp. UNC300MFChir4.1]
MSVLHRGSTRIMKNARRLTLLMLACHLATGIANAAALSDGAVRIGVINDQSGPLSDQAGVGSIAAARLAVEDFAREHPGLKVDVLTADHQNKPDVGSALVRRWFDVDSVDVIVDVGNSAVALAVQAIAGKQNKIVLYSAVATTEISGRQCSETGLAWLHDSYNLVAGPTRRLVAQGADTWFFIGADYAFGRNMVSETQRILASAGGRSLGALFHPLSEADHSSYLLQAQASGAKVVAFANAGAQLVSAMKEWHEFGMDSGGQIPVAQLMFLTDVHSMGPATAKGLTTLTAWYWNLNDETRAFAKRFSALRGVMPTAPHAAVYSSVLHYLRAVAAAGTDATGPVLQQMRARPVDDFYARGAKLRADGKLVHDFLLVQVKKPENVKQPWDYYEVVERVPASEAYPPLSDSECPLVSPVAARPKG